MGWRCIGLAPALGFANAARRFGIDVLVHPVSDRVLSLFLVPAAEQTVVVLGILEFIREDRRGIGVVDDVLLEVALVLEDVANDAAEEGDIRAGPDRHVDIGHGARAGKPRIDMDDRGAVLAGLASPSGTPPGGTRPCSSLQSRCSRQNCRSCWAVVAPPLPKEVPRLGTVEECQIRAWFSIWTMPSEVNSFLMT